MSNATGECLPVGARFAVDAPIQVIAFVPAWRAARNQTVLASCVTTDHASQSLAQLLPGIVSFFNQASAL